MIHYTTWPMENGNVAVCYMNHRGQVCPVMECAKFETAAAEAARMTRASLIESFTPAVPVAVTDRG
jgi:hypothetical protein